MVGTWLWQALGSSHSLGPGNYHHISLSSLWLFGTSFGMDLTFLNFLNFVFTWDWSWPPMFSMFTWLMFIPFSHVSFFTRSHGQEKSLSYYDLFDFRVLLHGHISTFIIYFLHNPTTPILPIYVDQQRSHLEKDTTRLQCMIQREISWIPRRTLFRPD